MRSPCRWKRGVLIRWSSRELKRFFAEARPWVVGLVGLELIPQRTRWTRFRQRRPCISDGTRSELRTQHLACYTMLSLLPFPQWMRTMRCDFLWARSVLNYLSNFCLLHLLFILASFAPELFSIVLVFLVFFLQSLANSVFCFSAIWTAVIFLLDTCYSNRGWRWVCFAIVVVFEISNSLSSSTFLVYLKTISQQQQIHRYVNALLRLRKPILSTLQATR